MNQKTDQQIASEQAAGLRALADMIEANPELRGNELYMSGLNIWHTKDAAFMADLVRAALRHGAKVTKDISETQHNVDLTWHGITASILARRDAVCERVVIDTREFTEEVPDPEALAAVPTVTVTRTEEVVEWQCKPPLTAEQVMA
jgi:hypothetical protein